MRGLHPGQPSSPEKTGLVGLGRPAFLQGQQRPQLRRTRHSRRPPGPVDPGQQGTPADQPGPDPEKGPARQGRQITQSGISEPTPDKGEDHPQHEQGPAERAARIIADPQILMMPVKFREDGKDQIDEVRPVPGQAGIRP